MTLLQHLESKIRELHSSISLRPTLERAAEIGELLLDAKSQLPHGKWEAWCRGLPFSLRSCRVYMEVAKRQRSADLPEQLSIAGFLREIRLAKLQANKEARDAARAELAAAVTSGRYRVVTGDCRSHRWPRGIDLIAADPPWRDMDCYKWLADFAANHLRPGGLLLAQSLPGELPQVLRLLGQRLSYVWLLAIVFSDAQTGRSLLPPIGSNWRPVAVFVNGSMDRVADVFSDVVTVYRGEKNLHDWQAPLKPWHYWLSRIAQPGWVIADPYAGVGTVGVGCKMIGKLRYLGVEIDPETADVARRRIGQTTEGT